MSTENSLQYIYETINMDLPSQEVDIAEYSDAGSLFEHQANERMGAALRVFIRSVVESSTSIEKIDRATIEAQVAFIDKMISAQLDEIVHSEPFQKLEAQWKQLKFLVDRTNFKKNVKIEILNVSKQEQRKRFLDRLDDPSKNWKFSMADVTERGRWNRYQAVYQDIVRHSSTAVAPWHVVPADHKWFARIVIGSAIVSALDGLNLQFPRADKASLQEFERVRQALEQEGKRPAKKTPAKKSQ